MSPKEELIHAIERSPDNLIRVLLELVKVWEQQSATLRQNESIAPASQAESEPSETVWTVLRTHAGSVEMPEDWAKEHDHYLYGTPKQASEP